MKKTIIALAVAMCLAACASNKSIDPTAPQAADANTQGQVKRKRVCDYEKTSTGSRLERVCKYVEVTE